MFSTTVLRKVFFFFAGLSGSRESRTLNIYINITSQENGKRSLAFLGKQDQAYLEQHSAPAAPAASAATVPVPVPRSMRCSLGGGKPVGSTLVSHSSPTPLRATKVKGPFLLMWQIKTIQAQPPAPTY